jgi:hypothetical protein
MESIPQSSSGYDAKRRSPRAFVLLLPITLSIVLFRLLLRALARSVLAFPRVALRPRSVVIIFSSLWIAWIVLRVVCFTQYPYVQHSAALYWLWLEARFLFLFPRALDGWWHQPVDDRYIHPPDAFWISLVLLVSVWTIGLYLIQTLLLMLCIGFSRDGQIPQRWPRPRLRTYTLRGFLTNGGTLVRWLGQIALVLLVIPPVVLPIWDRWSYHVTLDLVGWLWRGVDVLIAPRVLDTRMEHLMLDYDQRLRAAGTAAPGLNWSRPTLELVGIEVGVLAIASLVLSAIVSLLWGWRSSVQEASTLSFGPLDHIGSTRRSPRLAVVVLPFTLALALVGIALYRLPSWLPKLLVRALVIPILGTGVLFVSIWIYLARHDQPYWLLMQQQRHWWTELETYLRFPAHWHQQFRSIPHSSKQPIATTDLLRADLAISLVVGVVLIPVVVVLRVGVTIVKRSLEVIAR